MRTEAMTLTRRAALAAPAVLLPLAASPAWSGASDPADAVRSAERHAVALGAALTGLTRRTGAEGWVFHLCETWGPPPFHQHAFAGRMHICFRLLIVMRKTFAAPVFFVFFRS